MKSLTFIDLFAGAGGLSEGFIRAGYVPIAHVEMDTAACLTLQTRTAYHYLKSVNKLSVYEDYLRGLISRDKLYKEIPETIRRSVINLAIGPENNGQIHKDIAELRGKRTVDLIIGGPPCQAYSLVGRARSKNKMAGDHRNYLYIQYAKYLEKYSPSLFIFENVIGLKSAGGGKYLENMRNLFLKKGYEFELFTVRATDFGVLQMRRRIIIVGFKIGKRPAIPNLEGLRNKSSAMVGSIFADLPKINAGEGINKYSGYSADSNDYLKQSHIRSKLNFVTQHIARPHTIQDKEIYRIAVKKWNDEKIKLNYNDLPDRLKTHKNRHSFFDRFKIVPSNVDHSQTVVAHIAKDGHYYIHPDLSQNRSISVREAARLQSFPDNYYFEGVKEHSNRTAAFKQIGNAVPPLMAYHIAKEIIKIIR